MPFAIFAAVAAISAVWSAYSSIQQGQAAKKAANYQAAIQERNAQTAEQQARAAKTKAESDKLALRLRLSEDVGKGRTGYAAGNVALGEGSPVDWEADLRDRVDYDLSTIEYNADLEAWGYNEQASNYRSEASLSRLQGKNAEAAGNMGAVGSLLSGASTVAGGYYAKKG